MVNRVEFVREADALLQADRFRDYGPNGLQVEGRPELRRIASAVTASMATIEAAVAARVDLLLVHHGLFWRGHDGRVTGWMRRRLAALLAHDINLVAYHLPLDAHPELGNNAQLAMRLGLVPQGRFGEQDLGFVGGCADGGSFTDVSALASKVAAVLGRPPTVVAGRPGPLRRIAWCTGGAQSYFEAAIAAGADAFLTGEISEPQAHLARECGVSFLAGGHHATERFGAPALAAHLAARFGLEHRFLEDDNPA